MSASDPGLKLAELLELAALKLPLIRSRGEWIVLRTEDVDAVLAFFAGRATRGEAPAGDLLREGIGLGGDTTRAA